MVDSLPSPSAKELASNDKRTRDAACKALSAWLSDGQDVTAALLDEPRMTEEDWEDVELDARFGEKDLLILWKGLFYCMWMSDKPMVQQALCDNLAKLLLDVRSSTPGRPARVKAALAFLRGFWTTMGREWSGIDRLRMDKYYLLMRRYVTITFTLLMREDWDPNAVAAVNALLIGPGGPFDVQNSKTPLSILSHVSDIYLSSLSAALSTSTSITPVPLLSLLSPIVHALRYAPAKHIYGVAQSNAMLPLLAALDVEEVAAPPTKKRRTGTAADVARAFEPFDALLTASLNLGEQAHGTTTLKVIKAAVIERVFEEAAKQETPDANRRRMYALCREHADEPM